VHWSLAIVAVPMSLHSLGLCWLLASDANRQMSVDPLHGKVGKVFFDGSDESHP
jgi:hypothetical protein